MKQYRVLLPIEVKGRIYRHGETAELDDATAKIYGHALSLIEEKAAPAPAQGEPSVNHTNS